MRSRDAGGSARLRSAAPVVLAHAARRCETAVAPQRLDDRHLRLRPDTAAAATRVERIAVARDREVGAGGDRRRQQRAQPGVALAAVGRAGPPRTRHRRRRAAEDQPRRSRSVRQYGLASTSPPGCCNRAIAAPIARASARPCVGEVALLRAVVVARHLRRRSGRSRSTCGGSRGCSRRRAAREQRGPASGACGRGRERRARRRPASAARSPATRERAPRASERAHASVSPRDARAPATTALDRRQRLGRALQRRVDVEGDVAVGSGGRSRARRRSRAARDPSGAIGTTLPSALKIDSMRPGNLRLPLAQHRAHLLALQVLLRAAQRCTE